MTIRQLIARIYAILELLFLLLAGIWVAVSNPYNKYDADNILLLSGMFFGVWFLIATFIIAVINC